MAHQRTIASNRQPSCIRSNQKRFKFQHRDLSDCDYSFPAWRNRILQHEHVAHRIVLAKGQQCSLPKASVFHMGFLVKAERAGVMRAICASC
eukprot:1674667-Amphidinium_carterae.1